MSAAPHDALFKALFESPGRAAELLRSALPAELAARFDWDSLALQPGSFIDDELEARHTDLLFTAKFDGHPLHIYFLFEHKSSPPPATMR